MLLSAFNVEPASVSLHVTRIALFNQSRFILLGSTSERCGSESTFCRQHLGLELAGCGTAV